jgi:hypothetical protein
VADHLAVAVQVVIELLPDHQAVVHLLKVLLRRILESPIQLRLEVVAQQVVTQLEGPAEVTLFSMR